MRRRIAPRTGPSFRPFTLAALALAALPSAVAAKKSPCPPDMIKVAGRSACIDRYEASLAGGAPGSPDGKTTTAKAVSKAGAIPAGNVSQLQAIAACKNAGKRLCSVEEWTAACRGEGAKRKYPYGDKYQPMRCHDRDLSKQRRSVGPVPTGSLAACRTPEGVFDLSGNLWEWLSTGPPDGQTARYIGGGWGNDDDDDFMSCVPEEPLGQPVDSVAASRGFRCCGELDAK